MKINLRPHHQKHVQNIGIPEPPSELEVSAEEYEGAMKMWESTGFRGEDLRTKVAGHLAWKHHHKAKPVITKKPRNWEKWYLITIGVLLIIVLLSVPAHCQFSKIKTITVTDGSTSIFAAAPFQIMFSGCAVGGTGSSMTVTCSGAAANPGGSAHQLQVNLAGTAFAGIGNGTAGQVLCSNGTTLDPSMCDPIVSGPDAVAAAPTKNPVQVGCVFLTTPATLTNNQVGALQCDNGQNLLVKVSNFPAAFQANAGTNLNTSLLALETGGNLASIKTDVDKIPASPSTDRTTAAAPFAFELSDGAAFYVGAKDASITTLDTDVKANITLHAGTNVIGHVIADSGSTTAVTQATGTNLHAVIDTGSTTAVTQATGTNLHAVIDTGSTTAVTQATGTNLHTVVDSGAVTATLAAETTKVIGTVNVAAGQTIAVTNSTASNLNAQVVGAGADGSATSGNPVLVAGKGSGNVRVPVVCDNWKPFSLASTTALKLVTLASSKQTYICSINIVSAGANNVALIEGTKVTNDCDTSTAGMAGGTTAATGWNFAANGGLSQGSGIGVIAATATVSHDVCLLASASTQVSGVISWTQF